MPYEAILRVRIGSLYW